MRRLKLLASFCLLQGGVQFISAISGFVLIRVLDKPAYAAYTIACSMQIMLNILTDGGISPGLNSLGGRIWQDREALGRLVSTAFSFRRQLAWFAVPVATAFGLFLLRKNEVPWHSSLLLAGAVIIGLWGSWRSGIYAIPLRLHGHYLLVQRAEFASSCLRLALIGGMAFVFLNALLAILIFVMTSALQAGLLLRSASNVVNIKAPVDLEHRAQLSSLVRKQYLQVLFFAFQAQITIWLISTFGSTEKVADLGALSRLGIIFALVGSVVNNIVSPTFARCDTIQRLRRIFGIALVGYSVFSLAIMTLSISFPGLFLWLIGPKYHALTEELPWMMASGVVAGYTGILHALAFSRSWIWHTWLIPVSTVFMQIGMLFVVDIASVRGVLVLGIVSAAPNLIILIYMVIRGFLSAGPLIPDSHELAQGH